MVKTMSHLPRLAPFSERGASCANNKGAHKVTTSKAKINFVMVFCSSFAALRNTHKAAWQPFQGVLPAGTVLAAVADLH